MSSRGAYRWLALAVLWLGGCGNYSNEDLDFQLALPEQSDIEVKMQLSLIRYNSAEYYRDTRKAITTFNQMVDTLTGFIDIVRGITPTTRNGAERIWGPWPVREYPGWQLRLVMQRSTVSPSLLHMDYWLQLRRVGQDDGAWVSFLTGSYTSAGSARKGQGDIHLLASPARDAGYPVNDDAGLVDLDHFDVTYDNSTYPVAVTMNIVNLPTAATRSALYDYLQNEDGSGRMTFDWQGRADAGGALIAARMAAQWNASGAGRADLTAEIVANVPTLLGTDCWGSDTVASYTYRADTKLTTGDPATCVF